MTVPGLLQIPTGLNNSKWDTIYGYWAVDIQSRNIVQKGVEMKGKTKSILIVGFLLLLLLGGYVFKTWKTTPAHFTLQAVSFKSLPHWESDTLSEAWPAFIRSCQKLSTLPKEAVFLNGSHASDWTLICSTAMTLGSPNTDTIRKFFETNFTPYKVSSGSETQGLFTGYYEPQVKGSREKSPQYPAPMYKRPADLVMVEDLGIFRKDLKGMRIAGRVINGNLRPHFTHAEIDNGALKGDELLWIADPIDAFFIQIQGSAAVKLDNDETTRLTYAGTNGHPYTAIGRVLIEQQKMKKEEVSMQSIRAWLKDHPEEAKAIMHQNASFVFFAETKGEGPLGAQGVALTPGRSLAVDPVFIAYGTPVWLDTTHPEGKAPLQRLVIAQDKGGAIKGHIRGDVFWGTGEEAGELAGSMKSKGSYYVLLPNREAAKPAH